MQAFVDMQTDPEKAVAFRQAIIQSNGRTLAFMARAIDEHSCDTIKSSPHRMYRNRNDKRLGLEFQKKSLKNNSILQTSAWITLDIAAGHFKTPIPAVLR